MPAVHSRRVHLARISGESCPRRDWASATLYTLANISQFWRATQGDSQARHETLWLVHHRLLKKWDLNEVRHEHSGYMRGSKVRRVFPSTFSLSPCLVFLRRECTARIICNVRPNWKLQVPPCHQTLKLSTFSSKFFKVWEKKFLRPQPPI